MGIDESAWNQELEEFLRRIRPGGVIFFHHNIQTAQQFRELVNKVREAMEITPFLALDLEGGRVDRLRDVLASLPAARDVAKAGFGEAMGRMAGRELAAFSLNVDFAPVLDLGAPESREILGSRTASDSPMEVARFAEGFLRGLAASGVLGCGKHFPGLGSGQKDSHKQLPSVEKEESKMWQEDLWPFRALASKLPMIMVAHVHCPGLLKALAPEESNVSPPLPATLSRGIVSVLLKGRLGFQGLVLSDDLEMGGVLEGRTMAEAAAAALRAGCDMVLLCGPAANTRKVFEALLQQANSNPPLRRILEDASEKVLRVKNIYGITSGSREKRKENRPADPSLADFTALRSEIEEFSAAVRQRLQAQTPAKGGKEDVSDRSES